MVYYCCTSIVECTPGRVRETQKRGAIVCVGRFGWRMLIKTTGRLENRHDDAAAAAVDLGTGTEK